MEGGRGGRRKGRDGGRWSRKEGGEGEREVEGRGRESRWGDREGEGEREGSKGEGEGWREEKEGGGGRFPLLLISVSDELQHLMLHPHTLVYMIAHLYMLSFAQVICESCNCRDLDLC